MNIKLKLTIEDILKRPDFQYAKVVAGEKGINRSVRWVHIMEVTEIGQLINGDELILSTGVSWRDNKDLSLSFLQQLIDKNASGCCVEVGMYIDEIPQYMIDLANKHDFPIIVFFKPVRFIDVTQDLNGLFIETHYNTMLNLESVSNQFNKLLLSRDGFKRILRLVHQIINVQVVYSPIEGHQEFYPHIEKYQEEKLHERIVSAKPQNIINGKSKSASKPIQALGHKFADLIILSDQELTNYDYLVLDRAATALSQDQLRLLYVEEKKKENENRWLQEWLNGEHSKENVEQYLNSLDATIQSNGSVVCICKLNLKEQDNDLTYFSMMFRTILDQKGFYSLVTTDKNKVIFVLINQREKNNWKDRLLESIDKIKDTDLFKEKSKDSFQVGVGKLYDLDHLHKSFQLAKETLFIQKKIQAPHLCFYDELYIYRLISELNRENRLNEYIEDYIGPVLEFDSKRNGQMFETLKVYLEVNGSKKDAAERLYIVRQTLYHRIEKLRELLGENFMDPEKRLAIEFAIRAKNFLMENN